VKVKKWAYIAVTVFSAVVILWSLIAALSSTTISAGMAAPAAIGIILIFWSVYHLKYDRPVLKPKWLRVAFTVCVCLGIALILVLETLMLTAAYAKPEEDADVVIVLGCGIFPDGRLTLSLRNRLDMAYDYLIEHPDANCIVSGGQGDNEPVAEAVAMHRYLISRGIDQGRLFTETKSTSTEENLEFSLDIIEKHNLSTRIAMVTSDYHVFRASILAKRLGIDAYGIPSPTPWPVWLSCQARECMAIVKTIVFPQWKVE
jgi:uncharacterized SAM-binding protein YcdF (DUF218 family)